MAAMAPAQDLQRPGTGMSSGIVRSNTGMSTGSTTASAVGQPGDIQNTAEDIIGGQGPVFSDGNPYPVLGFGFCATRGRRPYNEDRIMLGPRLNGSPCPPLHDVARPCGVQHAPVATRPVP
jgi:hypothetical protein